MFTITCVHFSMFNESTQKGGNSVGLQLPVFISVCLVTCVHFSMFTESTCKGVNSVYLQLPVFMSVCLQLFVFISVCLQLPVHNSYKKVVYCISSLLTKSFYFRHVVLIVSDHQ